MDSQADAAFSVVIAYEDHETGQHARNVCDLLVETLGRECKFTSQMWRFDVLRIPECRETAAKGAAKADLIVISSHGVGDLPGEVKAWIELWLRDKGDLMALVALFDRPRVRVRQDWPIQEYLAGVAARAQSRVLCRTGCLARSRAASGTVGAGPRTRRGHANAAALVGRDNA